MWEWMTMARGVGIFALDLAAFLFAGCLLPEKYGGDSLTERMIVGFLVYFSIFQAIALPMKLLKMPLSTLTYVWCGFLILLGIVVLLFRRKPLWNSVRPRKTTVPDAIAVLLLVILAGALAVVLGMNINHISDFDAAYYIGIASSSGYSNTIELMDPYTGVMLSGPTDYYLLNTFTIHSAVMYRAFGIHPLLEQKFSMTMAMAVMFLITMFRGGMFLFKEDCKKSAVFSWFSLLTLWFSLSISGTSHYFAYRTYEGKSVCAFLLMPMLTVFFFALFQDRTIGFGLTGMFLMGICSAAFCNTAIFLVPMATGIVLLAALITLRKLQYMLWVPAVMLPGVAWLLVEVLR